MKATIAAAPRIVVIILLVLILGMSIIPASASPKNDAGIGNGFSTDELLSPAGGGPVPGGPGYVAIPAFSFKPWNNTQAFTHEMWGGLINNGSIDALWEAPFTIPNGTAITKMVVYYQDNEAASGKDLTVHLYGLPYFGGSLLAMGDFSSSGGQAGVRYAEVTPISTQKIDLSINYYMIELRLPPSSNVFLSAVRVDYGYSVALPSISK